MRSINNKNQLGGDIIYKGVSIKVEVKNNKVNYHLLILLVMLFVLALWMIIPKVLADSSVKLVVDGHNITDVVPVIKNDRTIVPIRTVAEQLGAEVKWNNDDRTVQIIKGDRSILLRIDSRLTQYEINKEKIYNLSDVSPCIIKNHTYVPLRLISNALNVKIDWNDSERTIYVDSSQTSNITSFFDMKISSLKSGQVITGTTDLQAVFPTLQKGAAEIKYLLIYPDTAKGFIIARGENLTDKYKWMPSIQDNGEKILVAAIYDANGEFLAGDSIPVQVSIAPQVSLTGLVQNQAITEDKMQLNAGLNFSAAYVKYEIKNKDKGKVYTSPELDPQGIFNKTLMVEDNGNVSVKVTAYDINDNPYPSQSVDAKINIERKLSLRGVSEGQTIDNPVTLSTSRNFEVSETEYVMRDPKNGAEKILSKIGYGNYTWFPGPEISGEKELFVRVKDTSGRSYTSNSVTVNPIGTPKILLQGIGPNQVITGAVKLKVFSNVSLNSIKYIMINSKTGKEKVVAEGKDYLKEYVYTPVKGDAGTWKIKAKGIYESGKEIETEEVPVTIYLDKIYTALPIIEKNKFIDMASKMAEDSWKKTGMSASLQTAQAILETGWGQSVPVDKYDGQLSYNLFGVKGIGTAGSVTSNTWEEYNGVSYRIDAEFRAYNNVEESWKDHNNLLLTAERYEPFREVMHDSTQGAWALRRAGYATDSQYSMKLIKIIRLYNLQELDKVSI